MLFGLFKKKSASAEAGSQHCACQPSKIAPTDSPFVETRRLTGPYEHENVGLARCASCDKTALYYSADVYDDFWQYWCIINETECARLLEDDDPDEPQLPTRARAILEENSNLVHSPVRGFEWVPPGHSVIEGPPW
jgi:hypothetical protein